MSYSSQMELSIEDYEIACKSKVLNFDFYGLGTIKIKLKGKPKITSTSPNGVMVKVNTDDVPKDCDFSHASHEYFYACWEYREKLKKLKEKIISEVPESYSDLEKYLVLHGYEDYIDELEGAKNNLHNRFEGIKMYLEK